MAVVCPEPANDTPEPVRSGRFRDRRRRVARGRRPDKKSVAEIARIDGRSIHLDLLARARIDDGQLFRVGIDFTENADDVILQEQHGREDEGRNVTERSLDVLDLKPGPARGAIEQRQRETAVLDWQAEQQGVAGNRATVKSGEENQSVGKPVWAGIFRRLSFPRCFGVDSRRGTNHFVLQDDCRQNWIGLSHPPPAALADRDWVPKAARAYPQRTRPASSHSVHLLKAQRSPAIAG